MEHSTNDSNATRRAPCAALLMNAPCREAHWELSLRHIRGEVSTLGRKRAARVGALVRTGRSTHLLRAELDGGLDLDAQSLTDRNTA